MGLRLERAACSELLADPAHRRDAVAETGGDLGRALSLVVELNDALANGDGDSFHGQKSITLPSNTLHYLWKRSNPCDSATPALGERTGKVAS